MTEFRYRDGNVWRNLFDADVIKEEWLTNGPYNQYDVMEVKVWLSNKKAYRVKNYCDNDGWSIVEPLTSSGFEYPKERNVEVTERGTFMCSRDIVNDWGRLVLKAGNYSATKTTNHCMESIVVHVGFRNVGVLSRQGSFIPDPEKTRERVYYRHL